MNFTHSDNEFHPPGQFYITFQQPFPLFCHFQQNASKNQKESETLKKLTKSQKTLFSFLFFYYLHSLKFAVASTRFSTLSGNAAKKSKPVMRSTWSTEQTLEPMFL